MPDRDDNPAASAAARAPAAAAPAKVLVVDDTPQNVKLLADVLGAKGYVAITAFSGEEGLAKVAAERPDLVLLDVMMPGINGIEALRQLRDDPATAAIPVIAVTASVMASDRRNITDAGFDGYVGKPLNLKEFLDAVAHALAARRA